MRGEDVGAPFAAASARLPRGGLRHEGGHRADHFLGRGGLPGRQQSPLSLGQACVLNKVQGATSDLTLARVDFDMSVPPF